MEQRLVEIVLPEGRGDDISELLHEQSLAGFWRDSVDENQARIRILLDSADVEPVLDILGPYLEKLPGAAAMLLIVEASIPRKNNRQPQAGENEVDKKDEEESKTSRISRHAGHWNWPSPM